MADTLVSMDKLKQNNQPEPVGPLNDKFMQPLQTKLKKRKDLLKQAKMPSAPDMKELGAQVGGALGQTAVPKKEPIGAKIGEAVGKFKG